MLRTPEALEEPLLRIVYLAMGVALSLAVYTVLVRSVRPPATVAAASVCGRPWQRSGARRGPQPGQHPVRELGALRLPVTLLVCLSVLASQRYEHRHRQRDLVMFLGLLGVLVLTRSTFQLVWYLGWSRSW
ncbi:MAG TPA: hypothetical protein VK975_03895 [Acidimicrobiales bacterium]|nr:hypothetical protein [Acidimicrobiales bacterium]